MKFVTTLLLALAVASTAFAGPQSTIGGRRLDSDMAHQVRTGWPSTSYEWWNKGKGKLDWALGGELVYGPWSGAWDDPRIAFALYAPLRFHLWENQRPNSKTDLGLRFTPGLGWVENVGFVGAIPLLFRLGLEIKAGEKTAPFVLMEVGPGFGFGQGASSTSLAARIWAGTTFWSVRGK